MDSFLCPNGTIFNQAKLVCDWWYSSDCAHAHEYYVRNKKFVNELLYRHLRRASSGESLPQLLSDELRVEEDVTDRGGSERE
jgi:hypothetical protein